MIRSAFKCTNLREGKVTEAADCIFLRLRKDYPTGVTFKWRLKGGMRCICVKEELERSAETSLAGTEEKPCEA